MPPGVWTVTWDEWLRVVHALEQVRIPCGRGALRSGDAQARPGGAKALRAPLAGGTSPGPALTSATGFLGLGPGIRILTKQAGDP